MGWLKSSLYWKIIWWRHTCRWIFLRMESKHCYTDGRTVWITKRSMWKNKPHLVELHKRVICSVYELFCWTSSIYIYIYICVAFKKFPDFFVQAFEIVVLLKIQYVIAIHLMRWLTNFYDFRFKWTATKGIGIHPTKAWLSQLVNFENAIWTFIIIMSRRLRGYPWPSLAISPYHSSPPAGLQDYNPCPHIAAVCKFVLVVPHLHIHEWGSTGVHRLWARPCFSSSVPRVWFVELV